MNTMTDKNEKTQKVWSLLIWLIIATMLLSACGAEKPEVKVYRVGILVGLPYFTPVVDGFKARMTELGYVEGQNINYEMQTTNFEPDKENQILQKFVSDKVDLILTVPTETALEAKAATQGTNIPVVFVQAFVEGVDLVNSVREPGGNITGVRFPGPDLAAKSVELLHKAVPQANRVLLYSLQGSPAVPAQLEAARATAAVEGMTLVEVPIVSPADVQADLQARTAAEDIGVDAILRLSDPLASAPSVREMIDEFSVAHKIPVVGAASSYKMCLLSMVLDNVSAGRQAAELADKILKGTPAGTIPVVTPTAKLQVNNIVAQELGLTLPEGLLKQADEIIH